MQVEKNTFSEFSRLYLQGLFPTQCSSFLFLLPQKNKIKHKKEIIRHTCLTVSSLDSTTQPQIKRLLRH